MRRGKQHHGELSSPIFLLDLSRALAGTGLIILFVLFCALPPLRAEEARLSWDPSPTAAVRGYRVYHGTVSGNYFESIKIEDKTDYTFSGIAPGVHYFSVTAYDRFGESDFSDEVSKTILGAVSPVADGSGGTDEGGAAPAASEGGGGGCSLRFPLQEGGNLLDRADLLLIVFASVFLVLKRRLRGGRPHSADRSVRVRSADR
ncbi:MAG: fibronectin type III domain-containing protein [Nitrospirae bacterium]|nr:fibronectin type III domain-containing protein [Candidatus Manganitrophaceae bacterium]